MHCLLTSYVAEARTITSDPAAESTSSNSIPGNTMTQRLTSQEEEAATGEEKKHTIIFDFEES